MRDIQRNLISFAIGAALVAAGWAVFTFTFHVEVLFENLTTEDFEAFAANNEYSFQVNVVEQEPDVRSRLEKVELEFDNDHTRYVMERNAVYDPEGYLHRGWGIWQYTLTKECAQHFRYRYRAHQNGKVTKSDWYTSDIYRENADITPSVQPIQFNLYCEQASKTKEIHLSNPYESPITILSVTVEDDEDFACNPDIRPDIEFFTVEGFTGPLELTCDESTTFNVTFKYSDCIRTVILKIIREGAPTMEVPLMGKYYYTPCPE